MQSPESLRILQLRVADDLARTAHPTKPWVRSQQLISGEPLHDVVIVGAGQGGLAVAFALMREQVNNIVVIDQAAQGDEGSWAQYARMPTLRSPKEFNGPDLGVPSLTYQSWHEAVYGASHWSELDRIETQDWLRYLGWFREILTIPVRNGVRLKAINRAHLNGLELTVTNGAVTERLHCRKLVLATGQDGTGRWSIPAPFETLDRKWWATTNEPIDFGSLRGRRVAVLGQGASAADNAACALENGAREVVMLVRRAKLQRVQPFLWLTFSGFLRHIGEMPDEWRWRFMNRILSLRESIPQPTWDRMNRHGAFRLQLNSPVTQACATDDGLQLETPGGNLETDYVILGTGVEIDFSARPELKKFAGLIATWSDLYQPPADEINTRLGDFPYLSSDGAFVERQSGMAPELRDIHDFTIGATMSFGPSGCSINAMTIAVPRLVAGITRGLFADDIAGHWASLQAYEEPIFNPE